MDKVIGIGHITANSVIVFSSIITKLIKKELCHLSFKDNDAKPFGRFPIIKLNGEIQNKFYIGRNSETHGTLLQCANEDNQKVLGSDWLHNSKYKKLVDDFKIKSAGRVWTEKKIIVMRDTLPAPNIVQYVKYMLYMNGINIEDYDMLYGDQSGKIHQCSVNDYINSNIPIKSFVTTEDLPTDKIETKRCNNDIHNKR